MNNHKRSREAQQKRVSYLELRKRSRYDRKQQEHLSTMNFWAQIETTVPRHVEKGIDSILTNVEVGEVLQDRFGRGTVQLLGGDLD